MIVHRRRGGWVDVPKGWKLVQRGPIEQGDKILVRSFFAGARRWKQRFDPIEEWSCFIGLTACRRTVIRPIRNPGSGAREKKEEKS